MSGDYELLDEDLNTLSRCLIPFFFHVSANSQLNTIRQEVEEKPLVSEREDNFEKLLGLYAESDS